MSCIFLLIALSAIPGGLFAAKYGNRLIMSIGIVATAIALLAIVCLPTNLMITVSILLIIVCLTWMTNGAVPLAINIFPTDRSSLAVGLYFGGFSAGMSSFNWLFNPVSNLTPLLGAIFGSIGLILAGVCVWQSQLINNPG